MINNYWPFNRRQFLFRINGDAQLRPVLDVALRIVKRDREGTFDYYFGNGIKRHCDAVIVVDGARRPITATTPYKRIRLKGHDVGKAVQLLVKAMKELIDQ